MEKIELYKAVISKNGEQRQQDKLLEEMSELAKAVLKYRYDDSNENYLNICDEMSDVEITMEQMRLMFRGENVDKFKKYKLERLKERILAKK